MRSNLISALRHILPPEECARAAFQLRTLMDGLWLRASFQTDPMPGTRGVDEVDFAARQMLLPAGVSDAEITAARTKMEHLSELILSSRAYRDRAMAG